MTSTTLRPVDAKPNRTRATIGGVGSGTGIVAIAQAVGPTTTLGAILLYLAPAISYLIGAVVFFIEVQASQFLERRMVKSARKTLREQLENSAMSREHKARIRRKLEQLEESLADAELARVKQIGEPHPLE